ncbi:MAG: ATP-binding cassette domain-containing protein [Pseudomonadota bacterium]
MPQLLCRALTFGYDGAATHVFSDLDLLIDTQWRCALVGANGRGKTTLLRLLAGELQPDRGTIECQLQPHRWIAEAHSGPTWTVAQDAMGPYRRWEMQMERLLAATDATSLTRYATLEERYRDAGGYTAQARLRAELSALDISAPQLRTPFEHLSGGEQTRVLLAALFARDGGYPLLDEPTNHLDRAGRALLGAYLAEQRGFLVVSHDRAFLDAATDHVIALNPDTVVVRRGSYSAWRQDHLELLTNQGQRNAELRKDISRLQGAAQSRRDGAHAREARKRAGGKPQLPSQRGGDSGFTGARAARQMKRALAVEARMENAVEQRRAALTDTRRQYPLHFKPPEKPAPAGPLIQVRDFSAGYPAPLFTPVSFDLMAGARLALSGPNGSGKTSLIEAVTGAGSVISHGHLRIDPRVTISRVWQQPRWRSGSLRTALQQAGLDEGHFRQLMAALGNRGAGLDQPLQTLSAGTLKKIELARSLMVPAHVYVWDEPLNYIDIDTRERIEAAIQDSDVALLVIEHDATFLQRIGAEALLLAPG